MPDPNTTLATATALAVGNTGPHTLNASPANDYYRFTLSGRSSLNLSLTGLDSNVDLQLLGSSGVVLQQSTNTGLTAESVNYTDLSAGLYYIRVLAASGTANAHYTARAASAEEHQDRPAVAQLHHG